METGASLAMKDIGKPCTGEPYARFDEGALMKEGLRTRSSRVRRGVLDMESAEDTSLESVLYSTRNIPRLVMTT